jgi:membrane protein DedA with SNARE-associated domain
VFGYGGLGYLFGTQWEVISELLSNISGFALGLVLLGIGVWLGFRRYKVLAARRMKVPEP